MDDQETPYREELIPERLYNLTDTGLYLDHLKSLAIPGKAQKEVLMQILSTSAGTRYG